MIFIQEYPGLLLQKLDEIKQKIVSQELLAKEELILSNQYHQALIYYGKLKLKEHYYHCAFYLSVLLFSVGAVKEMSGISFVLLLWGHFKFSALKEVPIFLQNLQVNINKKSSGEMLAYLKSFVKDHDQVLENVQNELLELYDQYFNLNRIVEEQGILFWKKEYLQAMENFLNNIENVRNVPRLHEGDYRILDVPFLFQEGKLISHKKAKVLNLNL